MRHPTPEELLPLLQAVDIAVWALAIKNQTRKGTRCKVNWKNTLEELTEAWKKYQIKQDDSVLVTSKANSYSAHSAGECDDPTCSHY